MVAATGSGTRNTNMGSRSANAATGAAGYGGGYSGGSDIGARSNNAATGPSGYGGSQNQGSQQRSANAATGPSNYGGGGNGYSGIGGGWNSTQQNALAGLNRSDRTLVENGSALGRNLGWGTPVGILAASEVAKTIYGELGPKYIRDPRNAAAIAQVALNRLGLASQYGRYHGSLGGVLAGFDATGYGYNYGRGAYLDRKGIGPLGNAAFQAAQFGTPQYNAGLNALSGQLTGTGPTLPDFVENATNYFNPDISSPAWGRGAQRFGVHAFNSPDPRYGPEIVAASRGKTPATGLAMGKVPGLSPGAYSTGTQVAATPASYVGRAEKIANSIADAGYRSSFPSRPEVPGSFPAAAQTTIAGRPEFPGSFPARQNYPSMVAGRPEYPGSFPAQSNYPSMIAERPEFPGALPAQSNYPSMVTSRPEFPGSFAASRKMQDRLPQEAEVVSPYNKQTYDRIPPDPAFESIFAVRPERSG